MKERTNYQIRSDLNVEFGNMNLWDDTLIVTEAAQSAIELFSYAVRGEKMKHEKAKSKFDKIAHVLALCYVHIIIECSKPDNEEKNETKGGTYDDLNA